MNKDVIIIILYLYSNVRYLKFQYILYLKIMRVGVFHNHLSSEGIGIIHVHACVLRFY